MALSYQLLVGNGLVSMCEFSIWYQAFPYSVVDLGSGSLSNLDNSRGSHLGEKFVTLQSSHRSKFYIYPLLDLKMCVKIF